MNQPVRSPLPDEVVLKVLVSTICGSDLHLWEWNDWADGFVGSLPLGVGHEMAGEVVDRGGHVEGLSIGAQVSVETHFWCGSCATCQRGLFHLCAAGGILGFHHDGAFAEYVTVPARNCWGAKEGENPLTTSLKEPFGNAVQTCDVQPLEGRPTLITGAGPLGLMTVMAAKARGAYPLIVSEPRSERREKASMLGADILLDPSSDSLPEAVWEATEGEGAEVLLELSGNADALRNGMAALAPGGDIALLGLPVRSVEMSLNEDVIFKGATIRGITGRLVWETWKEVDRLIHHQRVDPSILVTHQFPLEEHEEAFHLMERGVSGKIAFLPHGEIIDE